MPTGTDGVELLGSTVIRFGGTPTATGTFNGNITIQDGAGAQATKSYSITISPAPSIGSLTQTTWGLNQADSSSAC